MEKKKKFDIADSNIANLGSDLEKNCRKSAAETEKAWSVAGKKPGLQAWRIEKFQVVPNHEAEGGTFYSDDSYIVLNTWKEPDQNKLKWDIHFWLGETTSQDEAGTAAYKTVELDDFLGTEPVQHREVMGCESSLFLSYFEQYGGVKIVQGGVASGFNHVEPTKYEPRLLHLKGKKNIRATQVDLAATSINDGDVFLLDAGLKVFVFQGLRAGMNEKARGSQLAASINSERKGQVKIHVFSQRDQDDEHSAEFWKILGGKPDKIKEDTEDDAGWEKQTQKSLWQLSDASGKLTFTKVAEGRVTRDKLDSNDVFVFDIGSEVFAWVGKAASKAEKTKALSYATDYLKEHGRPAFLPVSKILEGAENPVFFNSFDR